MKKHTQPLASFVDQSCHSLFSIDNLPYGIFQLKDGGPARVGTAIGDYVLDLALLEQKGLLTLAAHPSLFNQATLNTFASKGPLIWAAIRQRIQTLLSIDHHELQDDKHLLNRALIPHHAVRMMPPFDIGGFSDFYASEHHATNVGRLFRPHENPLLPNWKYLPVAYNGRASTVFPSGTPIRRPKGQIKPPEYDAPIFSPSRKLDFELEMGIFVGVGNPDGHAIPVEQAASHIFGLVLLNDWSARDIQAFEYQPLGPFLSKSFATSISHWVVPMAALEEAMTPIPQQNPRPVDYLYQPTPMQPDIKLKVEIQPRGSSVRTLICETNCKELYWSMAQMLAHHTVNGCIMRPGDLLGTGTISGEAQGSWGSLLERSLNGKQPIQLQDSQQRTFLEDGDSIVITGYCQTNRCKIGFGTLEGTILPAVDD